VRCRHATTIVRSNAEDLEVRRRGNKEMKSNQRGIVTQVNFYNRNRRQAEDNAENFRISCEKCLIAVDYRNESYPSSKHSALLGVPLYQEVEDLRRERVEIPQAPPLL